MEPVVNGTFPVLLPMLQQLLAAPANSGNQVSSAGTHQCRHSLQAVLLVAGSDYLTSCC